MRLNGSARLGTITDPRRTQTGHAAAPDPDPAPEPAAAARDQQPLLVIVGPTATGKTALAIRLARAFDGEIISADSRQLYRGMDIGTAKPTPAERQAVPHHLIDVVEPDATFTLAEYQTAAYAAIEDIHARSKLPLLVGGTGQYVTAVVEGWGIPRVPPNADLRAKLEAEANAHGPQALHDRLRQLDPEAADRIDYRNVRRVVRALEVCLETGTPISELQRKHPPPYRILQLGLTLPREALYERIDARVVRMVEAGLVDEVRTLLDAGYTWEYPAMSGLGYAQWQPYLEGSATLEETITAIQNATHAFARRQYTWYRGHGGGIHWRPANDLNLDAITGLVQHWLHSEGQ